MPLRFGAAGGEATMYGSWWGRIGALTLSLPVVAVAAMGGAAAQSTEGSTAYMPRLARDALAFSGLGPCRTAVQVQNVDVRHAAQSVLVLFPESGRAPTEVLGQPIGPGRADTYYLPALPQVASGLYAGIVASDRRVVSLARTDCDAPDGTGRTKSAIYGRPWPAPDVAVPLVVKDYYGQCAALSIRNVSPVRATAARLTLVAAGTSAPLHEHPFEIGPGRTATFDLCGSEPPWAALPAGFVGSARVRSDSEVAVQSTVEVAGSAKAMYAFASTSMEASDRELFVPLFRRRQLLSGGGRMDTGISVQSFGGSPAEVRIEYRGADAPGVPEACRGRTFVQGPITIAADSSHLFYLGPREAPPCPGGCVPENCVGSARILSTQPVSAVVSESLNLTEEAAAYHAFATHEAALTVALPLLRAGHTALDLVTGVAAMNVGTRPATIRLEAWSARSGDALALEVADVAPMATALFWPAEGGGGDWADPLTAYGSALVSSDQPVVVVANEVSRTGGTDSSMYGGFGVRE